MTDLTRASDSWLTSASHQLWLHDQGQALLDFAKAARIPFGFASLDRFGKRPNDAQTDTVTTARMVHSFALAHIQGLPGCAPLIDHGLAALTGALRDATHGGWFATPNAQDGNRRKAAYLHAFVALAASSAVVAGRQGAAELLAEAVGVLERHFWSEDEGALLESFAEDWSDCEAYRGANSNMHGTETFLVLADVLDEDLWLDRALRIAERVIHQHAAQSDFLPIEHFDAQWQPLPDYNRDNPADPFRPYGKTPGHAFEWARLLLHLEAARKQRGMPSPDWLLEDARQLFHSACRHGWNVDGEAGIVYTLDWNHQPVVRERLHWTLAEAAAAAAALVQRTAEPEYDEWYQRFWDYIDLHLIDRQDGSWHHELGPDNLPSENIWPGKPDLYHAYQATLLPRLPLAISLASALKLRR
ncbi:AGE family epimerase/isomerase [Pseudomonas sp. NPDC096917]|uniref:D-mannose isomerase n=1 Tax=Pseudomonas sp. NPDC096917 TaxID=3364483 RepID=UPI00383BC409